jgi:hypothetical protein
VAAVRAAIGRRCHSLRNATGCPAVTTEQGARRGKAPASGSFRWERLSSG